jgi:hypothetical protein
VAEPEPATVACIATSIGTIDNRARYDACAPGCAEANNIATKTRATLMRPNDTREEL